MYSSKPHTKVLTRVDSEVMMKLQKNNELNTTSEQLRKT